MADLSWEEFVGLIRTVVREDREEPSPVSLEAIPCPLTATASGAPSVCWSVPLVSSTQVPSPTPAPTTQALPPLPSDPQATQQRSGARN